MTIRLAFVVLFCLIETAGLGIMAASRAIPGWRGRYWHGISLTTAGFAVVAVGDAGVTLLARGLG